ncbi:MAG: DUF2298 domain-containing protein, partial [Acidobacteriota bacterium]
MTQANASLVRAAASYSGHQGSELARRRWAAGGLACIVLIAGVLRFSGLGWDGWRHQHPDERFLVMVAEQLALPGSLGVALDPARTPANPNNRGFDFYVYGAFPPFVTSTVAAAVGAKSYQGLLVVGRVLAASVDLAALLLLIGLARRLGGARAATLAGWLYAGCALAIGQSRFATCDVWGTAFVLLAAWAVVGRGQLLGRVALAGAAVALAAACKPNLILAGLMPLAAIALAAWRRPLGPRARAARGPEVALGEGGKALIFERPSAASGSAWGVIGWAATRFLVLGAAALLALKLADPGVFAGTLSLLPNPRRLAALSQLAGFLAGRGQYPPSLQWADTQAVLGPLANLLIWGTGPALGLAVALGLGRGLRRAALGDSRWLALLAWILPAAAWHLSRFVCSVRHLEPFLPFCVLAAALWLARRAPWLRHLAVAATLIWGLLWASLAWRPYTRLEASRWMAANLPPGAIVTSEYWDDSLPLPGAGADSVQPRQMHVFAPDTVDKREEILAALTAADAVVLASQRGVGSICRVPDAYPLTSEYYHLLFSGALSFRLATHFERRIGLGSFSISDLAGEETLSVYDHPPVWIFTKTSDFDPGLARSLLSRVFLPDETSWETRDLEARGLPPYLGRPGKVASLPGNLVPGWARQLLTVIGWIVAIELAGLLGGQVLRRLAPGLLDCGWGAARWLGLALIALAWLWLGWCAFPGWNSWLPGGTLLLALPWGVKEFRRVWRERSFRLSALIVWAVFAFFLALRFANPEVYWGEKPMDAALLGAIWRAPSLPPGDSWFAGAPLNYYFFGFLPYAFLGRACGGSLGVVFNLAVATVPALTAGCALGLGWLLAGRFAGGALAAALCQLVGTAAVVFHPDFFINPEFNQFWASSRVIANTINEYPVWTALFADFHAHFLGFPGFLAAVLLMIAHGARLLRGRAGALAVGAVLAIEGMTNTWELPALLLLAGLAAVGAP